MTQILRFSKEMVFFPFRFCAVGDRLPNLKNWIDKHPGDYVECNATDLERVFCINHNGTLNCDPYFVQMRNASRIEKRRGIVGMMSGVIKGIQYTVTSYSV